MSGRFFRTREGGVEVPETLTIERDGRTAMDVTGETLEIDTTFSHGGSVALTPDEADAVAMHLMVWARWRRQCERGG